MRKVAIMVGMLLWGVLASSAAEVDAEPVQSGSSLIVAVEGVGIAMSLETADGHPAMSKGHAMTNVVHGEDERSGVLDGRTFRGERPAIGLPGAIFGGTGLGVAAATMRLAETRSRRLIASAAAAGSVGTIYLLIGSGEVFAMPRHAAASAPPTGQAPSCGSIRTAGPIKIDHRVTADKRESPVSSRSRICDSMTRKEDGRVRNEEKPMTCRSSLPMGGDHHVVRAQTILVDRLPNTTRDA